MPANAEKRYAEDNNNNGLLNDCYKNTTEHVLQHTYSPAWRPCGHYLQEQDYYYYQLNKRTKIKQRSNQLPNSVHKIQKHFAQAIQRTKVKEIK